ncbi:type II secretion system protein [Anaerobacillus sp. CMMVII]|uniref:type IV pilus modification PilV family protein n=1 Tax=Anaerobacillus sp. CMMVII TaxID=2755588 RepID=UPI0021B7D969|nr:type II secretion system protein [Anaerobacillus sp. CMMVII]MCT8137492.1 type II secretion system protein [Anaerobacillus sp. CMMVII]
MKNEKGVTLIELLVSIVLLGMIIVPLLMIMTGTSTRTVTQERETGNSYIAQEVMEKVRSGNVRYLLPNGHYCASNTSACQDLLPLPFATELGLGDYQIVEVVVETYSDNTSFHEVTVIVRNDDRISYGTGDLVEKENRIELITVVKQK